MNSHWPLSIRLPQLGHHVRAFLRHQVDGESARLEDELRPRAGGGVGVDDRFIAGADDLLVFVRFEERVVEIGVIDGDVFHDRRKEDSGNFSDDDEAIAQAFGGDEVAGDDFAIE